MFWWSLKELSRKEWFAFKTRYETGMKKTEEGCINKRQRSGVLSWIILLIRTRTDKHELGFRQSWKSSLRLKVAPLPHFSCGSVKYLPSCRYVSSELNSIECYTKNFEDRSMLWDAVIGWYRAVHKASRDGGSEKTQSTSLRNGEGLKNTDDPELEGSFASYLTRHPGSQFCRVTRQLVERISRFDRMVLREAKSNEAKRLEIHEVINLQLSSKYFFAVLSGRWTIPQPIETDRKRSERTWNRWKFISVYKLNAGPTEVSTVQHLILLVEGNVRKFGTDGGSVIQMWRRRWFGLSKPLSHLFSFQHYLQKIYIHMSHKIHEKDVSFASFGHLLWSDPPTSMHSVFHLWDKRMRIRRTYH